METKWLFKYLSCSVRVSLTLIHDQFCARLSDSGSCSRDSALFITRFINLNANWFCVRLSDRGPGSVVPHCVRARAHTRGVFCAPAGSWVESQSAAWLKCGTDELKSSNTVNHVTFTVKHQQLRWLLPQKLQYRHYLLKSILRFDFNFSVAIKIKAKEEIHNNTGTIQKK